MAVATLERKPAVSIERSAEKLRDAIREMAVCVRSSEGSALGKALIQIRECGIDPLESIFPRAYAASTDRASLPRRAPFR
jgi:hypothetical protein